MHGSRFRFQVPVPVSLYRCIVVSLYRFLVVANNNTIYDSINNTIMIIGLV
jgi:hypothetical protein